MDLNEIAAMMTGTAEPDPLEVIRTLLGRPAWHAQAACRGMGADHFVVGRGQDWQGALDVCRGCTVRTECAEFAANDTSVVGVWGGLTESQRRQRRAA